MGFPKKLRVIHRYADALSIVSASGSVAGQLYKCNGMFDPDTTGGGHQPSYFDNCAAIYDHYTVFRSRITIEVVSDLTSRVALYVDDDTSAATAMTQAMEQPSASSALVPDTTAKPVRLTKSWSAKAYFGGDIFDNDNLQGTSAADPVEQSQFVILYQTADGSTTSTARINVVLEFEAIWDELKTVPTN